MKDFNPNLQRIHDDHTIKSPAELGRRLLVEYIRQYAVHVDLTHEDIAMRTGLHKSNVSRVLTGKHSPTLDVFLKITGALHLRLELIPQPLKAIDTNADIN